MPALCRLPTNEGPCGLGVIFIFRITAPTPHTVDDPTQQASAVAVCTAVGALPPAAAPPPPRSMLDPSCATELCLASRSNKRSGSLHSSRGISTSTTSSTRDAKSMPITTASTTSQIADSVYPTASVEDRVVEKQWQQRRLVWMRWSGSNACKEVAGRG